jgi:hypothetical protein
MEFIVTSPCYEILRYGHDSIKDKATDAHTAGKLLKFIIGFYDLKDPEKPPTPDNFRFEVCQAEDADIVIFVDKNGKSTTLKDGIF